MMTTEEINEIKKLLRRIEEKIDSMIVKVESRVTEPKPEELISQMEIP